MRKTTQIFCTLLFSFCINSINANDLNLLVKKVLNKYITNDFLELKSTISVYDSSNKIMLKQNIINFQSKNGEYIMDITNDQATIFYQNYLVEINLKDSLIAFKKYLNVTKPIDPIGSFVSLLEKHNASFQLINSNNNIINVGIKSEDLPSDIILYSIDTVSMSLVGLKYYKELLENGKPKTVYIKIDYSPLITNNINSVNINKYFSIMKVDNAEKLVFSEMFKKFKIVNN